MASQSIGFKPSSVIKRLPWSFDRKAALGLLLILVTFSLVGWLYLGQASLITSSTLRIDDLRQDIDRLNQQNAELNLEIAEMESIYRIETRATELGLGPTHPSDIRYLAVNNYPVSNDVEMIDLSNAKATPEPSLWANLLEDATAWLSGNAN